MGYLYENSNPERFQHLCQTLLASDFPGLQCFPVGQRDGGRDGWDSESRTVLQVKFRRADEPEGADWLIKTLASERDKVELLAKRGAKKYVIATNARGTAQLDAGRIDRVQKWLDDNLSIPAVCLWRDELDRRFDKAPHALKLKYSELLSLEDGIEVVLQSVLGNSDTRRNDAVRSFIVKQFDADKTVKFKQVSLSNELLDLFIDVPATFPQKLVLPGEGHALKAVMDNVYTFLSMAIGGQAAYIDGEQREIYRLARYNRKSIGAAELLLSGAAQDHLKFVVLEGAPGQGKSTLAQYVCQMHRARYLKKTDLLERVPREHGQSAFRVPVKVDLRDYAGFLDGKSPFAAGGTAMSEPPSLDAFLAQLISFSSGGIPFDAHDVLSILKSAPVLLFLDGLDEVADFGIREKLVASVGDALLRWREFDADVQVVVTSRPSVFGRAPSLERFGFITLNLGNIDESRIAEYADKWIRARSLDETEGTEVKKILKEKLEADHIRDLTRNPMQLTILLSLIHQIGHSLPDQRTDLYRRYVDLFLTREADKSLRVRENRHVLVGFIQHLAWLLQIQAETSRGAGSITATDLQRTARNYLESGGHSVEIADDLFGGGLERIFVLVERIQGLYEFEVQPLREYFCAQYLYSTAPVGTYLDALQRNDSSGLRGDRAQRFEALARNPFWLNVCRFYAGSCERGETGTLVFSLREMIASDDPAVSIHARRVGLALLQDWVFSGVKYPQGELIRSIFDKDGIQVLFSADNRLPEEFRLSVDCGRDTLRDVLFGHLRSLPTDTRVPLICAVVRLNGGRDLYRPFVELLAGKTGTDRTRLLTRMFRSGAIEGQAPLDAWRLVTADEPRRRHMLRRSSELLRAESDIAVQIPDLVDAVISGVLDGLVLGGSSGSPLGLFADVLGAGPGRSFGLTRLVHFGTGNELVASELVLQGGVDRTPASVREFLEVAMTAEVGEAVRVDLSDAPDVWAAVIERARSVFGESWAAMSMALRTAGIATATEAPEGVRELFDVNQPLNARVRAARLRRGGPGWWHKQFEFARTSSVIDRMLWIGLVVMWSSVANLYALSEGVNAFVDALTDDEFEALLNTFRVANGVPNPRSDRKKVVEVDLHPFTPRAAVLVALAYPTEGLVLRYSPKQGESEPLREFLEVKRISDSIGVPPSLKDLDAAFSWAEAISVARTRGFGGYSTTVSRVLRGRMPVETAKGFLQSAQDYPAEVVGRAVLEVQKRYRPATLASVAARQEWAFD